MQRLVHVADRYALLKHFIAIHVGVDLRDCGIELRSDARQFGPLARRVEKLLQALKGEIEMKIRDARCDRRDTRDHSTGLRHDPIA